PVDELSSCESFYEQYGDAAIVTLARSGGEGADLPRGTSVAEGSGDATDLNNGDYLVLNDDEIELLEYLKDFKEDGTFSKIIVLLNTSNPIQLDFLKEAEDEYGIDAVLWVGDVGQSGITSVVNILKGDINPSGRIVDTFLNNNQSSPAMANFGVYEYTNTTELGLASAQNNSDTDTAANIPDSSTDADITKLNSRYVVEEEGIYVGYKYYETRYEDYVLGQGNAGEYDYSSDVAYPFGYGLSYLDEDGKDYTGSWDYSNFQIDSTSDNDNFIITLDVTNGTGVAGKHTVQIYMQSPYTDYDKNNLVEKSSVELVGFEKTQTLAAGAKESLTIKVAKSEMASYDSNGAKTYIVDPGDYYFTAGKDAHDAVNNIIAKKLSDGKIEDTDNAIAGRMDAEGDTSVVGSYTVTLDNNNCYTDGSNSYDANAVKSVNLTYNTSAATGVTITNQFDCADVNNYTKAADASSANETVTYLSRQDWTNTWPSTYTMAVTEQMWEDGLASDDSSKGPAGTDASVGSTVRQALISSAKDTFSAYYYARYGTEITAVPAMGQDGDMQLFKDMVTATQNADGTYTLTRVDIKDESWNQLLSQATYADMTNLIYNGFRNTAAIDSIGLPSTIDFNGPQGFTNAITGSQSGMAYTSEDVMAATFNRDLVSEMGACMGEDFLDADCAGIYGPGGNIHRTPYCGRNFEYYSEDGFLGSEMASVECAAIESKGVYVYMKHCVLNDMESGRYGLSTFANEQAIREIYLRPFEGAVESGDMVGVMTSFNRLGVVWSGASFNLITGVLREEFGMMGQAITDCTMFATACDYRLGVLAGQNIWDGMSMGMAQLDGLDNDAVIVTAVREGVKWIAYTISGSLAMNGIDDNTRVVSVLPWWSKLIWGLGGVFAALTIAGAVLTVLSYRKAKQNKTTASAGKK
ncbi:MAG: fibronectin type III-like domain-contianing protein, partial [Clostridia bacterium]|nr:fibronectin type III-like domain-contianing protein [Clostridia bacterium]